MYTTECMSKKKCHSSLNIHKNLNSDDIPHPVYQHTRKSEQQHGRVHRGDVRLSLCQIFNNICSVTHSHCNLLLQIEGYV